MGARDPESSSIVRGRSWLRSTRNRRLVFLLAAAGALTLVVLNGPEAYLGGFGSAGSNDFIEYWSAARLALDNGDPYDPAALLAVEHAAGWPSEEPLMMWNPPWTLALVIPVALLPFDVANFAWLVLQLSLVVAAGFLLWRYFAPQDRRHWLGLLLTVGFLPTLSALAQGQIGPWLLAGVVGFLWADRKGWDLAAGAALALLMIKPHVTYLFWLAATWWVWRTRRWGILVGWLTALIGASVIVLVVDSDIFTEYFLATARPPLEWDTPTIGTWLRVLLGWELTWLQFVPPLLGGLGLLLWLWRGRVAWRWELVVSPLLLASVVTTAFGWSFDHVVLLPAVAVILHRLDDLPCWKRLSAVGLLVVSQLGLLLLLRHGVSDTFTVWHAPALGGLYWWVVGRAREPGPTCVSVKA
jgi:hypothetical protein